jgi:hypothetical protein
MPNFPPIDTPAVRPLKAYAFDPAAGKLLGNEMTMNVRYEALDPGPVVREEAGERRGDAIAVVDYDGANKVFYPPVDLDDPNILLRGGLDPDEADPRFHQQMVYAVVTETIQHFETALGRRIHWRRADWKGERKGPNPDHIWTLNLYPHAFIGRNAFYSPRAHGILFGYFRAGTENIGRNVPGQTVFTCLSHDIVVHETTHAVVDGIRKYFSERTNPDVVAFHEAFADLVALFRHFTHGEVLRDTIQRTGGALYRYQLRPDAETSPRDDYETSTDTHLPLLSSQYAGRNPLIELAQQFGEATGRGKALRSALGSKPNSDDIKKITEPHLRGSILVAAVMDAFFAIYQKRTADLWRIFRAGGGSDNPTDVPGPLADRLCEEVTRLAEQFFQICVRALDYCPPVDITFGTYLRALVTADVDLRPRDEVGVRDALMQSFRMRGIYPDGSESFSEGAVAWPTAKKLGLKVQGLDFGDPNGLTDDQKKHNGDVLRKFANDPAMRDKLGFDQEQVDASTFHPLFRINADGSLRTDMIVELVQTRQVLLQEDAPELGMMALRAGATLLIQKPLAWEPGAKNNEAVVRYVIGKHLKDPAAAGEDREARQRRFADSLGLAEGNDDERFRIDFAMVHGV